MPLLIVEKGPERGQTVELSAGCRWVFGRDESCDFTTQDRSCSRRHFGIAEKDGRFILKDLKSTHGTSVNGTIIDMVELNDGDTIVAGETILSFASAQSSGRGLVGRTIAGYQIQERIGRGGMGTVFRARQVALDREVALKVLSARYSDDKTFINRFFKEAQAAARLNNPNVVQVYDVREEKGLYLISLEMMDGGTVQDLATREGQLPIRQVLKIAREAAKGLAYAEKRSIVHGDIKPDNLMMNADGHIKISDLGLARDVGEMTHQGEEGVFGTPHFISPEQAQGHAVDSRSDIYSLGATIYRLIAGTTPFSGSSVREIIMKQIQEEPPPLTEHRPDCPRDLADLVSVMMAKNPEDRFESAASLLAAIEALGDDGILSTTGAGRRKVVMGLVAAALVTAVVAFVVLKPGPEPVKPDPDGPRQTQPDPQQKAEQDARRAQQEKERRELEVKGLRANAELFLAELVRDGKSEDIPSLKTLITKYETALAAGPGTEEALVVQEKIKTLREKIASLEEASANAERAARAQREKDEAAFAALQKGVDSALKSHQFALALKTWEEQKGALAESHRARDLPALRLRVLEGAEALCRDTESRTAKALDAFDFDAAEEALKSLCRSLGMDGPEATAAADEFKSFQPRLVALSRLIADRRSTKADEDRRLDQATVFSAVQPYYRSFAADFDLDAKKRRLESLAAALQTDHFRPRIDRMRDLLGHCLAMRRKFIDSVSDSPGRWTTGSGSRELPAGKVVAATLESLTIEKRSGKKQEVRWTTLDAATLYKSLFRRVDIAPQHRLQLAIWLVECLLLDEAREVLDALNEVAAGQDDAFRDLLRATRKDLDTEVRARKILAEARVLRNRATTGGMLGYWTRLEKTLEEFATHYRGTRTYILNSDGTSPLE